MIFKDRQDAGKQLAKELIKYKDDKPIIIALPRGGVVLGYEVAKILHCPLDIIVPRKIGAPFHPEFGVGAIAPHGVRVLDYDTIRRLNISDSELEEIIAHETLEMTRRIQLYYKDLPPFDLKGKTVIIVDDGIATGVSTKAAIISVRQQRPKRTILAVPVCPPETAYRLRKEVDEFLFLDEPLDFYAVSVYYEDFRQVTDEEVISLLKKAKNNEKL